MPFCRHQFGARRERRVAGDPLEVQRTGLDGLRGQPGFLASRLLIAEDKSELLLIAEWESRDAFVAFRQTELGRQGVQQVLQYHPHISFYEVIASHDS